MSRNIGRGAGGGGVRIGVTWGRKGAKIGQKSVT